MLSAFASDRPRHGHVSATFSRSESRLMAIQFIIFMLCHQLIRLVLFIEIYIFGEISWKLGHLVWAAFVFIVACVACLLLSSGLLKNVHGLCFLDIYLCITFEFNTFCFSFRSGQHEALKQM